MESQDIEVMVADASHEVYVDTILDTIREAAKVRGTGIAERTHEYVAQKMKEGKAIIALCGDDFAGFTSRGATSNMWPPRDSSFTPNIAGSAWPSASSRLLSSWPVCDGRGQKYSRSPAVPPS